MEKRLEKEIIDCDLLVIGGGLAGCMAAIKGADLGVQTVMVEKANPWRSGAAGTGIDHIFAYFPDIQGPKGYTVDDLIEDHTEKVGGMVHQDILKIIAYNALDRIHDLEKMGVKIRYEQSELPGKYILVRQIHNVINTLNFDGRDIKVKMADEVKRRGARIVSRVMVRDLIVREGRVVGAIGVGTRDGKIYIFRCKAVVLSTARISGGRIFTDPGPGAGIAFNLRWPPSETGDGKIMAFNAGAELINLEFSHRRVNLKGLIRGGGMPYNSYSPPGQGINAHGDVIMPPEKDIFSDSDQGIYNAPKHKLFDELNTGRGPIYCDLTTGTEEEIKFAEWSVFHEGGGHALLHLMEREGIDFRTHMLEMDRGEIELGNWGAGGVYVDHNCASTIPGVSAAGDEIGGVPLSTAPGALTTGWFAAEKACEYISENSNVPAFTDNEDEINALEEKCRQMKHRKDGQCWQEAQVALNNVMSFYGTNLKTEKMLERGLENIDYLSKEVSLMAKDTHELVRCLEMENLIKNAELILRGNLERKESRKIKSMAIHVRLDYPEQDDQNWFCALSQKKEKDAVVFAKRQFRRI
jgi:succinate dehydrogenase/fumarate reductase flavoprotein subunit